MLGVLASGLVSKFKSIGPGACEKWIMSSAVLFLSDVHPVGVEVQTI